MSLDHKPTNDEQKPYFSNTYYVRASFRAEAVNSLLDIDTTVYDTEVEERERRNEGSKIEIYTKWLSQGRSVEHRLLFHNSVESLYHRGVK